MRAHVFAAFVALAACQPSAPPQPQRPTDPPMPTQAAAATAAPAPADVSAWVGRWQGVEGNYLDIVADGAAYQVTVQELDGAGAYPAAAKDGALHFTRRGVEETIRPGSGADTGLRYLADKTNCLVIREGEGFCR